MLLLSTPQQNVPMEKDPIALALVLGILLIFVILTIRKNILSKKQAAAATEVPVQAVSPAEAPGSAGQLKLHNVEPKTAAMLMAIVADKIGKPINQLRFISIQEVE